MRPPFPIPTVKKSIIVFSLMFLLFLILVLPYYVWSYDAPVGWDTAWYIYNMRLIAERGFPSFFERYNEINLYIIFEYFISPVFHASFALTEKLLPIILATFFPLVNFQIVKKFGKSWRLSLLAMVFSIVDFNVVRMVADLHRNLFCFLLAETALFLFIPDFLERASKKKFGILVTLLVVAGLSQMETFALVMLTLSFLLVFHLWQRSFHRAKLLLLCIIVPCLLVVSFESPFLLKHLSEHVLFNPTWEFSYEDFATKPVDYALSLGHVLIPLYVVGLFSCISTYMKNRKELFLLIPLWNIVLIAGSFLPWLTIKIPGKRFLVLATVPPLATIGFAKFSAKKSLTSKKTIVFITLIALASVVQFFNLSWTYTPWIPGGDYERLTWISDHKQNKSCVFVFYFDAGRLTYPVAENYRFWVWAVTGTTTNVYFGEVNYLLDSLPTPSENQYMNKTSYDFWKEMENLRLNESLIYLIKDRYEASLDPDWKLVYTGLYLVEA